MWWCSSDMVWDCEYCHLIWIHRIIYYMYIYPSLGRTRMMCCGKCTWRFSGECKLIPRNVSFVINMVVRHVYFRDFLVYQCYFSWCRSRLDVVVICYWHLSYINYWSIEGGHMVSTKLLVLIWSPCHKYCYFFIQNTVSVQYFLFCYLCQNKLFHCHCHCHNYKIQNNVMLHRVYEGNNNYYQW